MLIIINTQFSSSRDAKKFKESEEEALEEEVNFTTCSQHIYMHVYICMELEKVHEKYTSGEGFIYINI